MARDITSERLIESLTWEWQDLETLKLRLMDTVPPGKALRTYQDRYRGKGPSPFTEDEQQRSGARHIVNARIGSLVDSGRIEYNDDRTMIRLAERRVMDRNGCCPTCNRPFSEPTVAKTTPPPARPKVVYPKFPAWEAHLEQMRSTS